jgi:hypothetical protein
MNLSEISLTLAGSTAVFVLLLLLGIGLSVLVYRITIPPVSRRRKMLLVFLRSLAMILLILLLFEPLTKLIFRDRRDPVVAIVVDDSESMTTSGRLGDVSAAVRGFASLPTAVQYYKFASKLEPFAAGDTLAFRGEVTDIAGALVQLKDIQERENIQAVVLLSDGNFTTGRNPMTLTEDLRMPVYVVGVGDTAEQRDVLVARVATNNLVYANTRVPVDVRVRSSGYHGERVEVTLSHRGTIVDRAVLQIGEGTRDYTVNLAYEPDEEGVQKYTVAVSSLPGEVTLKNNVSTFFTRVLKTKLRILLIAGAPSPDVVTVRQTLANEQHFSIHALVQKSAGEFYDGELTQALVDSADCLVLVGFPSRASSPEQIRMVRDAADLSKKPVLFIGARTLDFEKLQILEAILPFTWTSTSAEETPVFAEVPEKQRSHVLVKLDQNVTNETWQQLPPIFKTQTVFHSKPESDVLAFAKVQSIVLGEPFLLVRNVARQKSLAVTGHSIWRWRLMTQGTPRTEHFFTTFLPTAVRWLTAIDETRTVRVAPTKEIFSTSDQIEFTGEVYDGQLRPIDDAELRVAVRSSSDARFETLLQSVGNGRYEGSIQGLAADDYSFSAAAVRDNAKLGEDKGRFSVGQTNVEFLQTRMNRQLLEQLAFHTGGTYVDLDHAATLPDSIREKTPFSPNDVVRTHEIELWNWQYLGMLLVVILAEEWFLRKKSGML